jgi:hypothetical protein
MVKRLCAFKEGYGDKTKKVREYLKSRSNKSGTTEKMLAAS